VKNRLQPIEHKERRRNEKMKTLKLLGLLVVLSMLFGLVAGCGPQPTEAPEPAEEEEAAAPAAGMTEVAPAPGFPVKVGMLFPMTATSRPTVSPA
jgi:hypothetical protein